MVQVLQGQQVQRDQQVIQDLLVLSAQQEQLVHKERLDLQVLQEVQEQREQQAQLELKDLLAQLDQLVPPDLPV